MTNSLAKMIHELMVEDNLDAYKEIYQTTDRNTVTDDYWKETLDMFDRMSEHDRQLLFKLIKQTMIDTTSNLLGVLDGTSSIDADLSLLIDGNGSEGDLQDSFLEYVEDSD